MPGVLERLRRVLEGFEGRHGRKLKMAAMDFGDLYWGDIGQHRKIHDFYMALNGGGTDGAVARAIAGIPDQRDGNGNILAGGTVVGLRVTVRDSVLINAVLSGQGVVERCVLIGTRAGDIRACDAFDVLGAVGDLVLEPRAGSYRVVSADPVRLGPGQRATTLFLPGGPRLLQVHEDTDLRDRKASYDVPIHGNAISFREAHEAMGRLGPEELSARRLMAEKEVLGRIPRP